jgi:hypothetical protein
MTSIPEGPKILSNQDKLFNAIKMIIKFIRIAIKILILE